MGDRIESATGVNWRHLVDMGLCLESSELSEDNIIQAKQLARVVDVLGLAGDAETLPLWNNHLVTPKDVVVLQVAEAGQSLGFQKGITIRPQGEALPIHRFGCRSVHFIDKREYRGEQYFLDIKGLGQDGKRLYTWHHGEGDPFHGLYLSNAEREFEIPRLMAQRGMTDIQVPVFLGEIPEAEYVRHATIGLFYTLSARLGRDSLHKYEQTISAVDKKYPSASKPYEIAANLAIEMYQTYIEKGVAGVEEWAETYSLNETVSVLTSGKRHGVSARLVKSTERIAASSDTEMMSDGNRNIARRMGELCRTLLESGFWATAASPGNWTTAGELIDFEDVIRWPEDRNIAEADMKYRKFKTLREYIDYTFGRQCLNVFTEDFRTGFAGEGNDDDKIAKIVESILREKQPHRT